MSTSSIALAAESRIDFATNIIKHFAVSNSSFSDLFNYNDWLQIPTEKRADVAKGIASGIFKPTTDSYSPNSPITEEDAINTIKGLDRRFLLSSNYSKVLGVVSYNTNAELTIKTNDGVYYKLNPNAPFFDNKNLEMSTFSSLNFGDKVSFILDKSNKIIFGWHQKTGSNSSLDNYEILGIYRANLYLLDDPRYVLVTTNAQKYTFGKWEDFTDNKYDDKYINPLARFACNGYNIPFSDINTHYLDKRINYIVGINPEDNGDSKILHVEIE
jgi:hypothetical protein